MLNYRKQLDFLKGKFDAGQLAHAYLFSGKEIAEVKQFTKEFIKSIDCTAKEKPCGTCQTCLMVEKESFPDLMVIKSINSESSVKNERDMGEIAIEQIRDTQHFLSQTSYYGNYKMVIVEDAERMTREAQNCFLKNLEEPKGKTIIFLLSSKPDLLLPTIFSRCQHITFLSKEKYEVSNQEQGILQNLLQVKDSDLAVKFNYAKQAGVDSDSVSNILVILQKHFRQMLFSSIISEKGSPQDILKLKKNIELIENIHYQVSFTNVNPKLALEIVLMEI